MQDLELSENCLQPEDRGERLKRRVVVKEEVEDDEVSFNPASLSPESQKKKRKRSGDLITSDWRSGKFKCVLCDRSFGTPTFLMQHYVTPHFSSLLRR